MSLAPPMLSSPLTTQRRPRLHPHQRKPPPRVVGGRGRRAWLARKRHAHRPHLQHNRTPIIPPISTIASLIRRCNDVQAAKAARDVRTPAEADEPVVDDDGGGDGDSVGVGAVLRLPLPPGSKSDPRSDQQAWLAAQELVIPLDLGEFSHKERVIEPTANVSPRRNKSADEAIRKSWATPSRWQQAFSPDAASLAGLYWLPGVSFCTTPASPRVGELGRRSRAGSAGRARIGVLPSS